MPARTSYAEGIPNWTDLRTTDPAKAKAFYKELFGWEYADGPDGQGGTYTMCLKGGVPAAGLSRQPQAQTDMGMPSMWVASIAVDDVEASTRKAEAAGGQVMMPPMAVTDAGRMSVVADPTGGTVILWEKRNHVGAGVVNEHGALIWDELISDDVPEAARFYGEVLGWTTEEMPMPQGPYTIFKVGDAGIAGAMAPPMPNMPNHWGVYFAVDDIEAALATVRENGGTVIMGPMDSPPGKLAVIQDPTGAMVSIMQPSQPVS